MNFAKEASNKLPYTVCMKCIGCYPHGKKAEINSVNVIWRSYMYAFFKFRNYEYGVVKRNVRCILLMQNLCVLN